MTTTVLDKIKAYKLEEIAADKAAKPMEEIEAAIDQGMSGVKRILELSISGLGALTPQSS